MQNYFKDSSNILKQIGATFFNVHTIVNLIICISVALIAGRLIGAILRKVVALIGRRADLSQNLQTVNRLRRFETLLVLSIALIKVLLFVFAIYFWWLLDHPDNQATGLVGASALFVILLSGSISPILRDVASGGAMMAEEWYGVGDHIKVEPFGDMQGVVERVTLRSTRIRGLNGEVILINNQNIQAVRIAPRGIRSIALEIFVTDPDAGEALIDATNRRLPRGPLLLTSPLEVVEIAEVGENLWQITAIGETAPGREWLIEKAAVRLITELDEESEKPVMEHEPLARFADREAEKKFKRTITNARKRSPPKKLMTVRGVRSGTSRDANKVKTIRKR